MSTPAAPDGAGAFVQTMTPRLLGYLHVLLGNLHDAEDVLQEVYVKYLKKGPAPEGEDARAWLFRVSRNEALNALRGSRRRKRRDESFPSDRESADPQDQAVKKESFARIKHCLSRLSTDYREVLYLKIVENRSFSELADLTALPRSTVALRIQEGLIMLNRCFHGSEA